MDPIWKELVKPIGSFLGRSIYHSVMALVLAMAVVMSFVTVIFFASFLRSDLKLDVYVVEIVAIVVTILLIFANLIVFRFEGETAVILDSNLLINRGVKTVVAISISEILEVTSSYSRFGSLCCGIPCSLVSIKFQKKDKSLQSVRLLGLRDLRELETELKPLLADKGIKIIIRGQP